MEGALWGSRGVEQCYEEISNKNNVQEESNSRSDSNILLFVCSSNKLLQGASKLRQEAGLVATLSLAGLQEKVSDVTVSGIIQDIPHALS